MGRFAHLGSQIRTRLPLYLAIFLAVVFLALLWDFFYKVYEHRTAGLVPGGTLSPAELMVEAPEHRSVGVVAGSGWL